MIYAILLIIGTNIDMTNTLNILDFDDNGHAVIEIPQIQYDYSLILNHWQDIECQLEEIEEDLSCCDTEERRCFLEKARKVVLEYWEKSEDNGSDEYDEGGWYIEVLKEAGYEEKEIGEFEFEGNEIDEVELKLSKSNIHLDVKCDEDEVYLCVYHFRLKHSLAWYLMNRLDHEIAMINRQIEKTSGLLKICDSNDHFDKAITIVKESKCSLIARNRLMKEFHLSEIQAEHILSTTLRELTATTMDCVLRDLDSYATVMSLLKDLKE